MKRTALSLVVSVLVLSTLAFSKNQKYAVVDSNGNVIGSVIGVSSAFTVSSFPGHVTEVVISVHDTPLVVDVIRSGFLMDSILFITSDCTGQPYLDASNASNSPFPATVVSRDNKLFAENGPAQSIEVLSYLDRINGCSLTDQPGTDAVPAAMEADLSVFKPPFKVVSQGKSGAKD